MFNKNFILKKTLSILVDRFGVWKINRTMGEIFDDKYNSCRDKYNLEMASYFDELSEHYDEINRQMDLRLYKGNPNPTHTFVK